MGERTGLITVTLAELTVPMLVVAATRMGSQETLLACMAAVV